MEIRETPRGFELGMFRDSYNEECSIQQSSIIGKYEDAYDRPGSSCIWLGVDDKRMHLNREQAKEVGELLIRWAETGSLREKRT